MKPSLSTFSEVSFLGESSRQLQHSAAQRYAGPTMTVTLRSSSSAHDVVGELQWLRVFAQRLASPADVDDLVQDTWVAAWRAALVRSDERSLRPWLARALRNRLRNVARGDARRRDREQRAGVFVQTPDADAELQRVALLEVLAKLLSELPEQDRRIIVRRYADEQNASEIADALEYQQRQCDPASHARWPTCGVSSTGAMAAEVPRCWCSSRTAALAVDEREKIQRVGCS